MPDLAAALDPQASAWRRWRGGAPERKAIRRAFWGHPSAVGTLWPTSAPVARALTGLAAAELADAARVAELGAGTGRITVAILDRCRNPEARVDAYERDGALRYEMYLRTHPSDRLTRHGDALDMPKVLDGDQAGVIVSALPWTSMHQAGRDDVMGVILQCLAPGGVVLALQYSRHVEPWFREHFRSVRHVRYGRFRWPVLYRMEDPAG